jgi:outer membrane receptor for ferrienterochelin and colicins
MCARMPLLLAACLFAALPASATPPPAPSTRQGAPDAEPVTGRVVDASGAAVPGATVSVRAAAGLPHVTTTGTDGRFRLPRPAGGPVRVTVTCTGFATVERGLEPGASVGDVVIAPAAVVEEVAVVSEARQTQLRESLNSRVDVVTRARMDEAAALTVADALQEVPGVLTRRGSETAGAAGEQIQGIDSRQVLVLIDGQPVVGARGIKRGAINLDRQSTGRLDRVEVVKGASSALYGSDAIGGVINMITRQPTAGLELGGAVSWGSFGDESLRAEAAFTRGGLSGFFTSERREHDGFDLTPATFDTTGAPTQRVDGLAKVRAQVRPGLAIQALATGYLTDTQGRSVGELGPQEDAIDEDAVNAGLTVDWAARPLTTVQARAYHAAYDESSTGRLATGVPVAPGALDERLTKIDVSASHVLGARQQLQGGAEWWRNTYDGINRLREDRAQRATTSVAWLQHRLALGTRVTTTAGVRVDDHSAFGTAVSPKVGVNARVSDTVRVRASYGRGFRAPDLGQLYYRFLNPTNFYQVVGNPSLEPETANSYQAGAEFISRGRRVRIGANLFRNDVHDLIESVSLGFVATPVQLQALMAREGIDPSFSPTIGRLLFVYRNVAEARTEGIEADGEIALSSSLSLGGAYTALRALDRTTQRDLTNRHPHQGHVRLAWQAPRFGLRANLRGTFYSSWIAARATSTDGIVTDTRAPRFALWDAYVSRAFGRVVTAFAALDNLTDSQDPNIGVTLANGSAAPLYRPEAGRTVRAGVRVQWTRK